MNFCLDCGAQIDRRRKRCRPCADAVDYSDRKPAKLPPPDPRPLPPARTRPVPVLPSNYVPVQERIVRELQRRGPRSEAELARLVGLPDKRRELAFDALRARGLITWHNLVVHLTRTGRLHRFVPIEPDNLGPHRFELVTPGAGRKARASALSRHTCAASLSPRENEGA